MWSQIAGTIPNIPPKGQLNGSTINVTYDNANDPDCCEFFTFCPLPPHRHLVATSRGWQGELRPHVVHVAKDMPRRRLTTCEASAWFPIDATSFARGFSPRFAKADCATHHFLMISNRVDNPTMYDPKGRRTTVRYSQHSGTQDDGLRV